LALDAAGGWLYFQALCGRTLYRVPTAALRDTALAAAELAARVLRHADSIVADGLLFAPEGIYATALEENAIRLLDSRGRWRTVAADPRLRWPDSLAMGPDGDLWVTVSQIHLGPQPPAPHGLYRLVRASAGAAPRDKGQIEGKAGKPRGHGRRTEVDKVHGLRR
jgi:sugar lactone lactonase YvrE